MFAEMGSDEPRSHVFAHRPKHHFIVRLVSKSGAPHRTVVEPTVRGGGPCSLRSALPDFRNFVGRKRTV